MRKTSWILLFLLVKRYNGKVFDENFWVATYLWSPYWFEKHLKLMDEARQDAMDYIRECHKKIWTRSQCLTHCKVDYVTNNVTLKMNKGQITLSTWEYIKLIAVDGHNFTF